MKTRVIVDEGVAKQTALWQQLKRYLGEQPREYVFLAKEHHAIPDIEILDKLLNKHTILVTNDKILHNRACNKGFRSFTLNEQGQFTRRRLRGIKVPETQAPSVMKTLQQDYTRTPHVLTQKIGRGLSKKQLKHYRTRRRRIRSYFGSFENIGRIAVTVDSRKINEALLCGFVMNIAGRAGVKGLRASEGYCLGSDNETDASFCLIHALVDLFCLQLESIAIDLFVIPHESLALCHQLLADQEQVLSPYRQALRDLIRGASKIEPFPSTKGRIFDAMQRKMGQLSRSRSNEVVRMDFSLIVGHLTGSPPGSKSGPESESKRKPST